MIKPKKSLGQNFLIDKKVINKIIEAAEVGKNDTVLEIGAGTGNLTKELAKKAGRVLALEFDRDLIPILKQNLREFHNVHIINDDILKIDLSKVKVSEQKIPFTKIVGSLPFQITSPLIHKLVYQGIWSKTALLIQKEVAQKICTQPPRATYLSSFIKPFIIASIVKIIPKTAFNPQPKVKGAIIKLRPSSRHPEFLALHSLLAKEIISESNIRPDTTLKTTGQVLHDENIQNHKSKIRPQEWSKFLHRGFSHPRKMLRNVLPEKALKKAEIKPQARAQELSLRDWTSLYKVISKKK